jgi:AraC-like DNA-binding protein
MQIRHAPGYFNSTTTRPVHENPPDSIHAYQNESDDASPALQADLEVGEASMKYLAGWRMQLAKQMMREGARNIQDVAMRVGCDSQAAFNGAFKRATGSPPAAWRRGAVAAGAGGER